MAAMDSAFAPSGFRHHIRSVMDITMTVVMASARRDMSVTCSAARATSPTNKLFAFSSFHWLLAFHDGTSGAAGGPIDRERKSVSGAKDAVKWRRTQSRAIVAYFIKWIKYSMKVDSTLTCLIWRCCESISLRRSNVHNALRRRIILFIHLLTLGNVSCCYQETVKWFVIELLYMYTCTDSCLIYHRLSLCLSRRPIKCLC